MERLKAIVAATALFAPPAEEPPGKPAASKCTRQHSVSAPDLLSQMMNDTGYADRLVAMSGNDLRSDAERIEAATRQAVA